MTIKKLFLLLFARLYVLSGKCVNQTDLTVLMYHEIIPEQFEKHLLILKGNFYLYKLTEAVRLLKKGRLPRNSVVITLDDGDKSHYKAYELAKKHNVPLTCFICPGQEKLHFDKKPGVTKEQVKEMYDSGMVEIGCHTRTHPELDKIPDDKLHPEIVEAKDELKKMIGGSVTSFDYPRGCFDERTLRIVRQNYECAVSTIWGHNTGYSYWWTLKRFNVETKDSPLIPFVFCTGMFMKFREVFG